MPLDVAAVWAEVNRVASGSRRVRAVLGELRLASLDATSAVLEGSGLAVSAARAVQGELSAAFEGACGRAVAVVLRAGVAEGHGGDVPGGEAPRGGGAGVVASMEEMRKHPLVTAAEEVFGARLVRVEARHGVQGGP